MFTTVVDVERIIVTTYQYLQTRIAGSQDSFILCYFFLKDVCTGFTFKSMVLGIRAPVSFPTGLNISLNLKQPNIFQNKNNTNVLNFTTLNATTIYISQSKMKLTFI